MSRWMNSLRARLARPRLAWLDAAGLEALDARPGQALDLLVSERLLQHLVCEPGLPLADEGALRAYARQLLSHYFGAAAQRWPLAPWRAGAAAGASALHGLDLAGLRATLAARQTALRGLRPAWAALLQALAPQHPDWASAPHAALAWVEGGLLCWLELRAGRVQALSHQRLAAPTLEALREALSERCTPGQPTLLLGYGLDAAELPALPGLRQLAPLDGKAPLLAWFERPTAPWAQAPRPDFVAPAGPRPARLAWPLAICGALVLATAAWSAWQGQKHLAQAGEQLAGLQARQSRQAPAVKPSQAGKRAAAGQEQQLQAQQQAAAAELQALLQQPWGVLLANVEQAGMGGVTPGGAGALSWLGLDYAAARRELRLEGLAGDQLQALQLVERLSAAPGWSEVVLSRFQAAEATAQGLRGQRFDLTAKLRPELLREDLARVSRSREAQP